MFSITVCLRFRVQAIAGLDIGVPDAETDQRKKNVSCICHGRFLCVLQKSCHVAGKHGTATLLNQ